MSPFGDCRRVIFDRWGFAATIRAIWDARKCSRGQGWWSMLSKTKRKGSYGVGLCICIRNGSSRTGMYSNSSISFKQRRVSKSVKCSDPVVLTAGNVLPGSPPPCARIPSRIAKSRCSCSSSNSLCCLLGTSTKYPELYWLWWVGQTTEHIVRWDAKHEKIPATHNRWGSPGRLV